MRQMGVRPRGNKLAPGHRDRKDAPLRYLSHPARRSGEPTDPSGTAPGPGAARRPEQRAPLTPPHVHSRWPRQPGRRLRAADPALPNGPRLLPTHRPEPAHAEGGDSRATPSTHRAHEESVKRSLPLRRPRAPPPAAHRFLPTAEQRGRWPRSSPTWGGAPAKSPNALDVPPPG